MIDQPVVRHVRTVPISVESHTFVTRMGGCRTEVRRFSITTPMITLLEAIGVTSNQKAGVKRLITGQQLVGVLYSAANDPETANDPRPEMIPKLDRK